MFNSTVLAHVLQPYHQGKLPNPDVIGQQGFPDEGPFMMLALRVRNGRVSEGRFETYGCPAAIACGSWLMRWIEGKNIDEVGELSADDLSVALGGLPLGKEHCAELTIHALRGALREIGAAR